MKIKLIFPLLLISLLLSGCTKKSNTNDSNMVDSNPAAKVLINELPFSDRPFVALFPHESNKLFTMFVQNADKAKTASVDLEYQSGDLLKGARVSVETPAPNIYTKAVILGSCSSGGKCTFDTDLKSGTMKFKLGFEDKNLTHLLKGDFTFINGQNNLPDGKVIFTPTKSKTATNYILMNSFGLPSPLDGEIALYPIVITSVSDKNIAGSMTINQSGVTKALIFDGTKYIDLKYTETDGAITVELNNKPWSKAATITRDDIKGTQEETILYLVGPIVLQK